MGALEGAGITVLAKGVNFPTAITASLEGGFPTGTTLLTGPVSASGVFMTGDNNALCHTGSNNTTNPFPSNFMCNPSSIDGLAITDSSQGGGGIFVHGWGHNLQIANNQIYSNAGTLSGGINLGQGEFAPSYIQRQHHERASGLVRHLGTLPTNAQLPYCNNLSVNVHNNNISLNSSTGDELFSGTPAGAGGVSICTGADYYKFNYNWICGNLSSGDGGGVGQLGFSYDGDIEHNSILFNQSLNPTIPANGGGLMVMGTPDADPTCGATTDQDCVSAPGALTPSDGVGPGLVINANLIMGNAAEAGSGGGLRLQNVNGSDVLAFPTTPSQWYSPTITNNIIADNVAGLGWSGHLAGGRVERKHHQQHDRFQLNDSVGWNSVHYDRGSPGQFRGNQLRDWHGDLVSASRGTREHPEQLGTDGESACNGDLPANHYQGATADQRNVQDVFLSVAGKTISSGRTARTTSAWVRSARNTSRT